MAVLSRIRAILSHRWAAFFVPVSLTLGFIGLSVLSIPDTLSFEPEPDAESEEQPPTTAGKTATQNTASPLSGSAAKKAVSKSSALRPIRSPLRPSRTRGAAQAPEAAAEDGAD